MILRLARDKNGNKIVRIQIPGKQGFSIQTNGNLPKTHNSHIPDEDEIRAWVLTYGTLRQKELMR